jgi:hypothetical protein
MTFFGKVSYQAISALHLTKIPAIRSVNLVIVELAHLQAIVRKESVFAPVAKRAAASRPIPFHLLCSPIIRKLAGHFDGSLPL